MSLKTVPKVHELTDWQLVIVSRGDDRTLSARPTRVVLGGAIVQGTVTHAHARACELVRPSDSDIVATSCMLDADELQQFGAQERAFDAKEAMCLVSAWGMP